jgi:hypothetical protein
VLGDFFAIDMEARVDTERQPNVSNCCSPNMRWWSPAEVFGFRPPQNIGSRNSGCCTACCAFWTLSTPLTLWHGTELGIWEGHFILERINGRALLEPPMGFLRKESPDRIRAGACDPQYPNFYACLTRLQEKFVLVLMKDI